MAYLRRKNKYKKIWVAVIAAVFLFGILGAYYFANNHKVESPTTTTSETPAEQSTAPTATTTQPPVATAPTHILLTVPFTSQAPFKVWDSLHEDACEEASIIMVNHFLNGTTISTPTQADKEIKDMISWETGQGYGGSITLSDLSTVAKKYLKINNGQVIKINSYQPIKDELAAGHPVILGMAGKILPNPNYSNGGPNYHMLVAIGYDSTGFITNDPGTRLGQNFHYNYADFYNAIHDWDPNNILNGQKAYLVFK